MRPCAVYLLMVSSARPRSSIRSGCRAPRCRARPTAATRRSSPRWSALLVVAAVDARGAAGHDERRDGRDPRRARRRSPACCGSRPARRRQRHLLPRGARRRRVRPALRAAARALRDGGVRRSSPAASGRGCRSRCWRWRGWARAPGSSACVTAGSRRASRSSCSRRTAWVWGFVYGAIMNLWFWPFARRRRARLAPGPRPRRRRCTTTGRSTWRRRSGGTPPARSPTRVLILAHRPRAHAHPAPLRPPPRPRRRVRTPRPPLSRSRRQRQRE